jgi:hypothetical protein
VFKRCILCGLFIFVVLNLQVLVDVVFLFVGCFVVVVELKYTFLNCILFFCYKLLFVVLALDIPRIGKVCLWIIRK